MTEYTIPRPSEMDEEDAQEMVRLWRGEGCSLDRLADKMGVSSTASKARFRRAMELLDTTREELLQSNPPSASDLEEDQALAMWIECDHNTVRASDKLRLPRSTFRNRLRNARLRQGNCPPALSPAIVPEGMHMRKSTVQYDAAGNVVNEWRRLGPDEETLQAFADRLCEQVAGKAPRLPKCLSRPAADLMLEIPLFDRHFGMYAWSKETGTDFDLNIAYKLVTGQTSGLFDRVGPVGKALLVIGGDFFHADNRHGTTERGNNPLDVDTRQGKVWDTATKAIYDSVAIAATKAAKVQIVVIPGNHDWESSYHLGRLLAAYYRNDPRVEVVHGPKSRQYIQHGVVLLGFAHGHLMKMENLAGLMADEVPDLWAATKFRAWHLGHIHRTKRLSYMSAASERSVEVEHLETTTSPDAWHHENGFVGAPRRGVGFTWSAASGLIARNYINASDILGK